MAADATVKWFHSNMANSPQLSNAAGSLVAVLDACLVDGFDLRSINSIVIAGGIATATLSGGHAYEAHAVVRIAGASPAVLNRDWKIASVTASTFTFDVSGTGIADGSATGTMIAKRAPAGWQILYTATDKRVYKSADIASLGFCLRVDDTGTGDARVVGYESMTDVDTGSAPFPTATQISGGGYWHKANNATGTRPWAVASDGRVMYYDVCHGVSGAQNGALFGFGDLLPAWSADSYAAALAADTAVGTTYGTGGASAGGIGLTPSVGGGVVLPRAANGAVGAVTARHAHVLREGANYGSGSELGTLAATYPAPAGAGLFTGPASVISDGLRGWWPGIDGTPQGCARVWPNLSLLPFSTDGRQRLVLTQHYNQTTGSTTYNGVVLVDITGPWR